MAAGVTAGILEEDLAPDLKKKKKAKTGKREQRERKMKIGDRKTERQKWNRGLEGGREMDNDDWTSAVHNRAIGWREAELMREVHMRWRERERDGRGEERRGARQMGAPWFLSAGA